MSGSLTIRVLVAAAAAVLMIGCGETERNAVPAIAREAAPESPAAADERGIVLFVGTSLTAGLGVPAEQAYPARIQEKIDSAGLPYRVVNAGVSGETSAGALRRIDWLLRQPVEFVVIETGANDMLRGADLDSTRANIQGIIDRVRAEQPDARVVLVGMMAPPNLGREYADRFRRIYPELARENDVALVPFLLEDVGGVSHLNQADGIHPTPEGHRIMAETVWEILREELE